METNVTKISKKDKKKILDLVRMARDLGLDVGWSLEPEGVLVLHNLEDKRNRREIAWNVRAAREYLEGWLQKKKKGANMVERAFLPYL